MHRFQRIIKSYGVIDQDSPAYFKRNNIAPSRKRTGARLAGRFGPSRDTHREAIVCRR